MNNNFKKEKNEETRRKSSLGINGKILPLFLTH